MKTIRVGSRESALAAAQSALVIKAIRRWHPGIDIELVTMKTTGDRILDRPLDTVGGKGLFIKELDEALLAGTVDICVHSYKDMPVPDNPDLPIVAVPAREDPRDVLLLPEGAAGAPDTGLPLGTASQRRRLQAAALFPGWRCEPVRGNVQTRLRKMDGGGYGGLILAAAGLNRLGLQHRASRIFGTDEMIPAACQGMLAVQGRAGEDHSWLAPLDDPESRTAAAAERAFIQELDGGCSAPTAAYAAVSGGTVRLSGMYADDSGRMITGQAEGSRDKAAEIGARLAESLRRGQ